MSAAQQPVLPQFTHYVRRDSEGGVDNTYPAMKYPPGFEDAHPEDWRPATPQEILMYQVHAKQVRMAVSANPDGSTNLERVNRGSVAVPTELRLSGDDDVDLPAQPSTITLAPEDPVAPTAIPVEIAPPPAFAGVNLNAIPPAPQQ